MLGRNESALRQGFAAQNACNAAFAAAKRPLKQHPLWPVYSNSPATVMITGLLAYPHFPGLSTVGRIIFFVPNTSLDLSHERSAFVRAEALAKPGAKIAFEKLLANAKNGDKLILKKI